MRAADAIHAALSAALAVAVSTRPVSRVSILLPSPLRVHADAQSAQPAAAATAAAPVSVAARPPPIDENASVVLFSCDAGASSERKHHGACAS